MQVFINGNRVETKVQYLAELLNEQGFKGEWLATAQNSELVSANERALCLINENDRIEVLSPMQGG
ncbi:sulfur carrier protein ThiS [Bartonella sp. HY761]|uniref:sulfur carrier protein ThiS n=1 Tax=Bartonella sp. HY761 TaxID=2979330 RepID=UPI0021F946EC|nr:sulfur carrier protein ThiS [Bartonella sp. HY761]UXN05618.1 sulfur carrier protein ThiS [Bartonella sp. HY761]